MSGRETVRFAGGLLAEIFLTARKASGVGVMTSDAAVMCSIALQHGVPLDTIRRALMRDGAGRASGPLGAALDLVADLSARSP
jgi:ribonucleoside-diphosphate reductase alpha chain